MASMETEYSRIFLKYTQIWRSSKWSNMASLHEASSIQKGLHLTDLLAKGVLWETPNIPDCCQGYRLLSTNLKQGPITQDNTHITH